MMLKSYFQNKIHEAGCDEVGRGCIAGPVVAGAVILPKDYKNNDIKDSKLISQKKRRLLDLEIKKNALAWSIGLVNNKQIDKINILNSSILAIQKAIDKLKITPRFIIVDGNQFKPFKDIPYKCIIKGDNKFLSIAAAAIIAKNYRDKLMTNLSKKYKMYSWETNYGYPTLKHKKGIQTNGITKYHRKSFKLI